MPGESAPNGHRRMTVDEFLAWLDGGPEGARYELVAGEVVAMAPEPAARARLKAQVWWRCTRRSNCAGCRARLSRVA
jgi:Uma2 family endonuclease